MKKRKKPEQVTPDPPTSELRVLSVQVRNVLGIDERALDPQGRAVVLEGRNASGKSSLLSAVRAGLSGGSLATLARVGAKEEPEVVLVLSGPGGEYRVEKKGEETARVLKRIGDSQAFADVRRPQQFLSRLFDSQTANPVAWLMAKPKDQAILLLEALPLEMDETALAKRLGDATSYLRPMPPGLHPLEHLSIVRDQLFTARTGVNRDAKSKAQAAEQLRRELPAKAPEDPAAEIVAAEKRAEELAGDVARDEEQAVATEREAAQAARTDRDAAIERVRVEFKAQAAGLRAGHEKRAAALLAEVERQIAGNATAVEKDIGAGIERGETEIAALERTYEEALGGGATARAKATEALRVRGVYLSETRERLATLREQAEQATRFRALDEQAGGFEADARHHEEESDRLSEVMNELDAFRRGLCKDLPIPGLEIEGAEIRLDGIPFDQVNRGRRVEVAAKVAQARADLHPLKVLFLDDLEKLDTAHRTALLEYLVEHGVQAFGAVVTDGDPAVSYVGAVRA